jgi:hypothetical protein
VTLQYQDVYDNIIDNELQFAQGLANFYYRASLYTTGAVVGNVDPFLVAENFKTNQETLKFTFTQEENASYFGSSGSQRYYDILFNVTNEGLENSVLATVFHIPAQITDAEVYDFSTGTLSGLTGEVLFNLTFSDDAAFNYIPRSVDVYTGANQSVNYYSLDGFSLLKNVPFLENGLGQSFSVFANEVPSNQVIYYQFVPYDDFGSGYIYTSGVPAYLKEEPDVLNYGFGIPPVLSFENRTGLFYSGNATAQETTFDGGLIYQTGASGQKLLLVQSGQWKEIPTKDDISGAYVLKNETGSFVTSGQTGIFCSFVNPPLSSTSNGKIGQISVSGEYLFAATGNDLWGRVLLQNW